MSLLNKAEDNDVTMETRAVRKNLVIKSVHFREEEFHFT